jgi:hypothetical protein
MRRRQEIRKQLLLACSNVQLSRRLILILLTVFPTY